MAGNCVLGPVLRLGSTDNGVWQVHLMLVHVAGAAPQVTGVESAQEVLATVQGHEVRRYTISVTQTAGEQRVAYQVDGVPYEFVAPPVAGAPTCAYVSCNGFSDPKLMKCIVEVNAMWQHMAGRHALRPFHVLLMGGDQVYSDGMWQSLAPLKAWSALSMAKRIAAKFTPAMAAQVDAYFFKTYVERWSQPDVARMMAGVPTAMMWDDHDILDGWGSYPADLQGCAVFQGIYAIARKYFELFQLQTAPGTPFPGVLPDQPGYSYGLRIGAYGVLVLDLRSERSSERVMGEQAWASAYAWLDQQVDCRHMLVMSSIPVVHPDFSTLEALLGALPGQQELEDDLRDHWLSRTHRQERLRLVHRLLDYAAATSARVTLLSGDVHVGALGVIESDRRDTSDNAGIINQLTSSGVVHPAPPAMALFYLEHVGDRSETVDRGITAAMYPFPGTSHRYIGARNYLSLEPDFPGAGERLWANWWVEGETQPYTKAIHAVPKVQS